MADGQLYLLATDIGYLQERDIVWERLNQVDGDSTLCDGDFRALDLEMRAATQAAAAAEAAEAAEIAAAADAAEAEAAARSVGGGGGGGGGGYATYPASAHSAAAATGVDPGLDPDYALALALQREEQAAADQMALQAQQRPPVAHQAHGPGRGPPPAQSVSVQGGGGRRGRSANRGNAAEGGGGGDCVLL